MPIHLGVDVKMCKAMMNRIYTILPHDKCLHMIVCAVLCGGLKHFVGLLMAILVTLAIGIGKEIWDKTSDRGTADMKDLLADCIGIVIGAL